MATFRPSGVSVSIKDDLDEGSSRSGTTLNVDSIITKDSNRLAMTDVGDIMFFKIDEGTSNEEICSCTGLTDNTTSMQLTGCVWGYNFYNGTGDVDANKKKHNAGATLIVTNDDHFLSLQYVNIDGAQTVSGVKTFSANPIVPTPTAATHASTKAYVDGIGGGAANYDQEVIEATAGTTIAEGEMVYLKESDAEWYLTDASVAGTSNGIKIGIAQGAGTDGAAITGGVLLSGLDQTQTGMTPGAKQYLSDTAGELSESAGTVEVLIGWAQTATQLVWGHNEDLETVTASEKDALGGTSGTPSSSNKYVTDTDETGGNMPIGSIMLWGAAAAPSGFVLCDDAAISRTTFSELFAIIGTGYGVGDGSTTFNVPDLRGNVPVGLDTGSFTTLGAIGGEETHVITEAEMAAHTHTTAAISISMYAQGAGTRVLDGDQPAAGATGSAGSNTAHNNLQPYQVFNYIIKT